MPFGLTNAPVTFASLMNNVLAPYIDDFIVVYLDDIVVYLASVGKHLTHLCLVFQNLREN